MRSCETSEGIRKPKEEIWPFYESLERGCICLSLIESMDTLLYAAAAEETECKSLTRPRPREQWRFLWVGGSSSPGRPSPMPSVQPASGSLRLWVAPGLSLPLSASRYSVSALYIAIVTTHLSL